MPLWTMFANALGQIGAMDKEEKKELQPGSKITINNADGTVKWEGPRDVFESVMGGARGGQQGPAPGMPQPQPQAPTPTPMTTGEASLADMERTMPEKPEGGLAGFLSGLAANPYRFDRRAGWGNVLNALGAGAQGMERRTEDYRRAMDVYQRNVSTLKMQLERNEIDTQEAQSRMEKNYAQAKKAESEYNAAQEPVYWDTATAQMGPSQRAFFEQNLGPMFQYGSDKSKYIPKGVFYDFMGNMQRLSPKHPMAVQYREALISDFNSAIAELDEKMAASKGNGKGNEELIKQRQQMIDGRDSLRKINDATPENEVDETLSNTLKQAQIEKTRAQTEQIKQGRPERAPKPDVRPIDAMKNIDAAIKGHMKDPEDPQYQDITSVVEEWIPYIENPEAKRLIWKRHDKIKYGAGKDNWHSSLPRMYNELKNEGRDIEEIWERLSALFTEAQIKSALRK